MKKTEIFDITLTSVFVAIILMMSLVQQLGFLTILPGVAITLVHIPTMIGIFILKPRYGFILGVIFGLGSLIASYMYGATAFDLAFHNPLVSVLPRALFGVAAWGVFQGLQKLSKIKNGNYLVVLLVSIIAIIATVFGARQIAINGGVTNETTMIVVTLIASVFALAFVAFYIYLTVKNNEKELYVSSSFIVGTLVHTVLVLTAVVLFSDFFEMSFGDAVPVILGVAASNGLIEALAAAVIGTPIYIALRQLPQLQRKTKKHSA
ncbi:ECF transporter S component [Acholeplasma hippikon]|uniref:Predicted membrane protein n=1 Tax=Acholeplasma hippikon TaxID=264636 RepID=A0A449BJ35_9MOLU|nr:ECF transporter S component [Acholeplasma hippikon]VEU82481.1 Predicted membrane protein [Acholeplasma hippikon]